MECNLHDQPESQSVANEVEWSVFKPRDYCLPSSDVKPKIGGEVVTGGTPFIAVNRNAAVYSGSQPFLPAPRTFVREETRGVNGNGDLLQSTNDQLPNEDVKCHAVTSESLGPSMAQQGKLVTTTSNLSHRLYGGLGLSSSKQSQNSYMENGSENISLQPSSIIAYQDPNAALNKAESQRCLNSHLDSHTEQNLSISPHSKHGPRNPEDGGQHHGMNHSASPTHRQDHKSQHEVSQYLTQQQAGTTNMEITSLASNQTHGHRTLDGIRGNTSAESKYQRLAHQTQNNLQHNASPPVDITRRPHPQPTSIQYHDSGPDVVQQPKGRKVFILHYIPDTDIHLSQAVLSLAVCLRNMKVDISIDMFEKDPTVNNWSIWYEKEILSSSVVLCIITPNFYSSLTDGDRVRGYSVYNLLNNSKGIAFRAVFLDRQKNMEDVPLSMKGATCYSISSQRLNVDDEEFASLYAFLTGQNRVEKPPLGNMVVLSPRRSKFSQRQNSQHTEPAHASRMIPQHRPPVSQPGMIPQQRPTISQPGATNKEHFDGVFSRLRNNVTPIKSLGSQQKLFMTMASNLAADWEILGRMLDVSEADVHAIKRDYRESVKEQTVQVLRKWLDANGTKATVAVISTAIYESGSQYWNLLDVLYKQTSKHLK